MCVELHTQREVVRLSSIARNRKLLAREVHIRGDAHSGSLTHLGTFAAMLSGYLPRLEDLRMSNDAPKLLSCLSTFTTIRGLHLVDVALPSTTMFTNVVSALTHLRYVTCYGVSVDRQDNHAALPNPTPPSEGRAGEKPYPRRELRLDCRTDMEAALSSLAAAGFTPEVHKITVDLKGSPARLEALTTQLHRLHQLGHLCLTNNSWKVEDERKLFQGLFTSAVVRLDLIHVTLPSPTFLAGVLCALVQLHTVTCRDVRFASTTSQQNSHGSRSSSPSRQGKLENLFRVLDLHVASGTGPGGFAPANLPLPDCCNVRLVGSLPVHRLETLAEMLSKYGGRHGSSRISDAVWGAGRVTPIGGELNPMTVDSLRWVSLMPAMGAIRNLHLHNVELPSSGMFVRIIRNLPQLKQCYHVPPVAPEGVMDRVSPVGRHPTQAWFLDLDCLDMYDILACVTTTPSWSFKQQLVSFGLGIHAAPVSGFGGFRYRDYAMFVANLESITHLGFVIYEDLPLDQL
ncbi:uncharacterized protein B0H18DRAFT_1030309, partial [Fomitopsis serialis]|uniref:uncharacterized protein n=1 Tax=Fomitopsis serialis TaxID=139415 RepID=UPI0020075099